MDISLAGKTALVTGGSRGVGRAMCERFLRSGATVITLARRRGVLDEAIAEIRDRDGLTLHGIACDVADEAGLVRAWDEIRNSYGGVDILVNNAASSMRRPIQDLKAADFHSDIEQKVTAVIRLSQLVLPGMRERRWGRIINIVSIYGKMPQAASAPTSVSRAAGIALTKAMSHELAPDNITVNALCLGSIESDQWRTKYAAAGNVGSYEEFIVQQGKPLPMGRLGRSEELANVACFIASEQASYVSGTAINVDGALSAVV